MTLTMMAAAASGPAPVTHGGGSNNTEGDVSRKSNMARKKRDRISVVKEIDSAEERLQSCRNSLEEVDYRLRKDELTEEGRQKLEKEKNSLTNKMSHYEKELKSLRHENRKNAMVSFALFFLIVLVYYLWTM